MEINLEKLAFNLDFHPLENLVSAALVNGDLLLYRFSSDSTVLEAHAHIESCRVVRFIDDGRAIVMGLPDRLILAIDVETSGTIARLEDAHGEAINKIINLHQSKIASRDDGGCIKVWDTRQRSYCGTCQAHEDYVFDMTFVPDAMKLLGTSVDETLSVFQARSEFSKEELVSVVLVKSVCEGQTGTVDADLNSIYMTIFLDGLIVGFTVRLLDKTCVLTGFSLAGLIEIGSVYPTITVNWSLDSFFFSNKSRAHGSFGHYQVENEKACILAGLALMPRWFTIKPKKFLDVNPKVYFAGSSKFQGQIEHSFRNNIVPSKAIQCRFYWFEFCSHKIHFVES
ncbi:hypothetical protein UlMin_019545 [Ulmus minor]